MNDLLNAAQRSSLAIALRLFERELRQADAWLKDGDQAGLLFRRQVRLSPARRDATRRQIALALGEIADLSRKLGLERVDESAEAAIAAGMSLSWANLCDMRADKLKRYGPVDPALAETLDAPIERLAQLALSLASSLGDEPPAR